MGLWMASKRRVRRKSCEGKKKFDSMMAARAALFTLNRGKLYHRLHCYQCQFCKQWHLGHLKHKVERIVRNRLFKSEFC